MAFDTAVMNFVELPKFDIRVTQPFKSFFDLLDNLRGKRKSPVMVLDTKVKKNRNSIKVPRSLARAVDPETSHGSRMFKKIDVYNFYPGNGSIHGNFGAKSESELTKSLRDYANGAEVPKKILTLVDALNLGSMETIAKVIPEGALSKKRPLQNQGSFVYAGSFDGKIKMPNYEIGYVLSDVTLETNKGRKIYLSVKYGNSVNIANLGLKKHFKFNNDGSLVGMSELGTALLKTLGINPIIFSASIKSYVSGADKKGKELIKRIDPSPELQNFVSSLLGWGYYYVHDLGNKIVCLNIDREANKAITKIKSAKVRYPGKRAKEVSVDIECAKCSLNVRIRNTEGGIIPNKMAVNFTMNL